MNSNKHVVINVAVLSKTLIVFSNGRMLVVENCRVNSGWLGQFLTFLNGKMCPNHPELTLVKKDQVESLKQLKIYLDND